MNRTLLNLLANALIFSMILAGCGGGGGGGGSSDNSGNGSGSSGTALSLFTDKVNACTPNINGGNSAGATTNLDTWPAWNPDLSGTVLGKLFDPANGKHECIYSQVQILDSHIQLVNQFSDKWLTSGVYTQGSSTATVDTTVSTVTIPFLALNLGTLDPMDRLVTLSVPDQNLTIHMAFSQNGSNQTIVEQYTIGTTESGVFLARVIGNDVEIWCASITESTASKVQIMWEGNTAEKSFSISECTNASSTPDSNWEVMGGGGIASSTSEMAFMARNDQNDNSSDFGTYYITPTLNDLENGTLQPIINFLAQAPDPNTDSVEAYITEGNASCIGFLGRDQYPNAISDLAWSQ
ncbi:MAG: hypothetical protein ABSA71_19135 [Desulfomonilia bacterium]